jgi:pentose-5-phosphate-3-epimerase
MAVICPSILAADNNQYRAQIQKIGHFAERIQIDLTDGDFAKSRTVMPEEAWWPVGIKADFHLMYRRPARAIDIVLEHKPNLVIIHAEADGNFVAFAEKLHNLGIKVGVALLAGTQPDSILPALDKIDHVLIFSGNLGEYGGHVNLDLLKKAHYLKQHRQDLEIGWDGGINTQNISLLAAGGVDVFNVGGFIQSSENPEHTYKILERIADETGTT